jgi:signal transduction histidine kinase
MIEHRRRNASIVPCAASQRRYRPTVGFEAGLRAYLEQLDHAERFGGELVHRRIDEYDLRAYFLHRLRQMQETEGSRVVEQMFRRWSPQLAQFAQYVSTLPIKMAPTNAADAQEFAKAALDAAMGLGSPMNGDRVDQLELERIASEFQTSLGEDVEHYAVETRLVRDEPGRIRRLSPLGTAFLRLRGKDAVRWLLTSEVLQTTGRRDPWRTPGQLLEQALKEDGIMAAPDDQGYPMMPFDTTLLARLADLGVLYEVDVDNEIVYGYGLAGAWRDALLAVLRTGPWHHAISAILAEDQTGLVPTIQTATEGVVEQAKVIAHEVRNALVPARIRLDTLRAAVPETEVSKIDAVKRGVVRVLTFVEEMVATGELVAEPTTPCDLEAVIREAVAWIDDGERVLFAISSAAVRVRAPRTQLARSVANLVRNALQATQAGQAVRIGAHRGSDNVRIVVDDAGPGVPDDARERVFQEGYTTRTDGSGYGLAYVRRVVVDGLRGRVWCEASDLGGARFVIEFPEVEVER